MLFETAKQLFGLYVSYFPSYQLIYGAFAAVPLFLLWVYLSWMIVLFGAELVCGLSSSQQWRRRPLPRLLVMLMLLRTLHQRQQEAGSYICVTCTGPACAYRGRMGRNPWLLRAGAAGLPHGYRRLGAVSRPRALQP